MNFKVVGKDWGKHVIEHEDGRREHLTEEEFLELQGKTGAATPGGKPAKTTKADAKGKTDGKAEEQGEGADKGEGETGQTGAATPGGEGAGSATGNA